jgi:uncharacterized protein (DUF1778 family)
MERIAPPRIERVDARLREGEKQLVILAAKRRGISISELVRLSVLSTCSRILQPEIMDQ